MFRCRLKPDGDLSAKSRLVKNISRKKSCFVKNVSRMSALLHFPYVSCKLWRFYLSLQLLHYSLHRYVSPPDIIIPHFLTFPFLNAAFRYLLSANFSPRNVSTALAYLLHRGLRRLTRSIFFSFAVTHIHVCSNIVS